MIERSVVRYIEGTLCRIEECSKPVKSKGLCKAHYERQRLGKPLLQALRPREFTRETVLKFYTEQQNNCLVWTGSKRNGYGVASFDNQQATAHRVAWELVNGPIPEGLELDHDPECPRNCVTVEHLTPRTKSEHARVGWERGQFEGNGWTKEAREKRTKTAICILCDTEYTADIKSKYCSKECTIRAGNLKRKERRLGLDPGTLCPTLEFDTFSRKQVWEEEKGICGICLELTDPQNWHLDHKVPRSKGGEHIRSNVQVSHPSCNLSKGNKM